MAAPKLQSLRPAGWCTQCGAQLRESSSFCSVCGASVNVASPQQTPNSNPPLQPASGRSGIPSSPHHPAARGFTQAFGLHPAMALLTVAVNAMIFGDAVFSTVSAPWTAGLSFAQLVAVSTTAGGILGYITYMAQQKWYGDDKESAKIKALIVGFLTAIPVGLPGFLVIPSGVVGLFRRKP
jgi:hypothetical protein